MQLSLSRLNISWRKTIFGFFVLFLVTTFWVGATQFLKSTYNIHKENGRPSISNITSPNQSISCVNSEVNFKHTHNRKLHHFNSNLQFSAPFFSCWFCTAWTALFLPLFLLIRCFSCQKHDFSSINYQHMNFSKEQAPMGHGSD